MSQAHDQHFSSLNTGAIDSAAVAAEVVRQRLQIAALETELAEVKAGLFGRIMGSALNVDTLARVVAMTEGMFPGESAIEVERDPGDPENPWLVITVPWRGTPRGSVEQQLEWHARLTQLCPEAFGGIRLSMVHCE